MILSNAIRRIFDIGARDPEAAEWQQEVSSAISHLKNSSDRVLRDIGLSRDEIECAVRHGNAANQPDYHRRVA